MRKRASEQIKIHLVDELERVKYGIVVSRKSTVTMLEGAIWYIV